MTRLYERRTNRVSFKGTIACLLGWAMLAWAETPAAADHGSVARPPAIVSTTPGIGATNVDPATSEIVVVFDQDMAGGFSWTGGGPEYPPTTGRPFWLDARTCVLPVTLKPNHEYRLGLNSISHVNFQSTGGVPLVPIIYTFRTGHGVQDGTQRKP